MDLARAAVQKQWAARELEKRAERAGKERPKKPRGDHADADHALVALSGFSDVLDRVIDWLRMALKLRPVFNFFRAVTRRLVPARRRSKPKAALASQNPPVAAESRESAPKESTPS